MVLEAINRVNKEIGTLVAIITHNVAIAQMADRVVRIADGTIRSIERNPRRASIEEVRW